MQFLSQSYPGQPDGRRAEVNWKQAVDFQCGLEQSSGEFLCSSEETLHHCVRIINKSKNIFKIYLIFF